jgi:hypothetical protein
VSLGKQNRIDNALKLLELVRHISEDGVPDIKPDAGCYVSILSHLAQNHASNSADQALNIVKRMKEDIGTVPTVALNLAIDVCSKTVGSQIDKRKALEAAFRIFQFGRESSSCDAVTYGLMMRACINLTEDEDTRTKLVEVSCMSLSSNLPLLNQRCALINNKTDAMILSQPIFKLCTKSGMVGNMVMSEVKSLKKSLVPNDHIPAEWTMNSKD